MLIRVFCHSHQKWYPTQKKPLQRRKKDILVGLHTEWDDDPFSLGMLPVAIYLRRGAVRNIYEREQ